MFKYKNNICSLDNKTPYCLNDNTINYLKKKILKKNIYLDNNKILKDLSEHYNCPNDYKREYCIIKLVPNNVIDIDKKNFIIHKSFKPQASHNGNDWLDNSHLDTIQEQLYKKYKGYYYSYIHMIDMIMIEPQFSIYINHAIKSIYEIDFVEELKNSKDLIENGKLDTYSVIVNTDTSDGRGLHWFCLFFDFRNKQKYTIEYFNSSGNNMIIGKFKEYLENLQLLITFSLSIPCEFIKVSDIVHQNSTSGNCGVYALYYVWSRLENKPISFFNDPKNIITDDEMENFRKILFISNDD